ncbi:MAG: hypothetical protein AMDU1_APLC00047G0017 [Thermoplasmatales archaeon A-plasma]|jgi:hypothetical protein|nr:MAG: hypothetical protein AMDU1_APLC00047G0017 [Thermoplasmatales archaeon A-plasma]
MGKITDTAIAVIVIIVGLWILTRLGLSLPSIEHMFRQFFFPSSGSPANNTTASAVFGIASASRIRTKIRNRIEERVRNRYINAILSRFRRRERF